VFHPLVAKKTAREAARDLLARFRRYRFAAVGIGDDHRGELAVSAVRY